LFRKITSTEGEGKQKGTGRIKSLPRETVIRKPSGLPPSIETLLQIE